MIDWLALLERDGPLPGRHVIVTAHPDDETISMGGALSRMQDAVIVQLTTGAGAGDAEAAQRRRGERAAAFAAAKWPWPVLDACMPDCEAHRSARALMQLVWAAVAGADAIWTHPYEAGHLDHDTAAWIVQRVYPKQVARMEFASYHCTRQAQVFGEFWPDTAVEAIAVTLEGDVLARKRAAMAAYGSQAAILRKFPRPEIEAYRVAPMYDFTKPAPPPRCRWDVKGYRPTTREWRRLLAEVS